MFAFNTFSDFFIELALKPCKLSAFYFKMLEIFLIFFKVSHKISKFLSFEFGNQIKLHFTDTFPEIYYFMNVH